MTFLGDGLPHYRVPDLVPFVAGLRELMTAYTPISPSVARHPHDAVALPVLPRPCSLASRPLMPRSTIAPRPLVEALYTRPVCHVRGARIFCCWARSGHRIWRLSTPWLTGTTTHV